MHLHATLYDVLNALTQRYGGRSCRRCSEPIAPADRFGMSEAVCPSCRV